MRASNYSEFSLLEHVSDAVALFSKSGELIYTNEKFNTLDSVFRNNLIDDASGRNYHEHLTFWRDNKLIKQVPAESGYAFFVTETSSHSTAAEQTLKSMLQAVNEGTDIYQSAATAIQACLNWRWVAITRFVKPTRLEVLSFIDVQTPMENFEYDVAGTPCEMVVDSHKFTVFSDLQRIFPNYEALKDMGAQTYAGLIYRGKDDKPLGHIMAMHDARDVDFGVTEDVIKIATFAMSSHFQLQTTVSLLEDAKKQVRIDALTGIGNRLAYEDTLQRIQQDWIVDTQRDWTIALIDLDRLKPLNDNKGHAAGDEFIKLIAIELSKMGRETDLAFRLGGDEFTIIFSNYSTTFVEQINKRFLKALGRIRETLGFNIDASIGFASLLEVEGDVPRWCKLADERMYQQKTVHRSNHLR